MLLDAAFSVAKLRAERDAIRRERDGLGLDNIGLRIERDANTRALQNLLAIIHRDGGHHSNQVGVKQAVDDAHLVWASLVQERDALKAENAQLKAAVEYLLEEHGGSVNIRHIKEAPGYTTVVYCPWCGDEEPCRVGRRVAEILAAPVEEPRNLR